MPFFTYRQNNSGSEWVINDALSHIVIIEATSAAQADELAIRKGIYFDGVSRSRDCKCCGDRWNQASDAYGTGIPTIYSESLSEYVENLLVDKGRFYYKEVIVYYSSGNKVAILPHFSPSRNECTVTVLLNGEKADVSSLEKNH